MSTKDRQHRAILEGIAERAMLERGLLPDFSPEALTELSSLQAATATSGDNARDMSDLLRPEDDSLDGILNAPRTFHDSDEDEDDDDDDED